jgi:hypothetical protein
MASPQSTYANIGALKRTVSQEIYKVLGLAPDTRLRHLLRPLVWAPTTQFAHVAANFDRIVADSGFLEAIREVLPRFINRLEVSGQHDVPEQGPLLIAANHPGAADAIAVAASLSRRDLKMVISALPFVRELPNAARHFIYTTLDPHQRMEVVRSCIRHLKEGGALLIFPRGVIEPDPEVLPGADESLEDWSASVGVIARSVPQLEIVTAIVSGVLNRRSVHNPVTRLRKEPRERQKLAEIIQVIQQMLIPRRTTVNARVSFGAPISAERLEGRDARSLTQQVIEAARQLLSDHMALA